MVNRNKGFTLFELIIIIGILGLTMSFAAPGLKEMVANNRISSNANDLVAAMQLAKTEAAARLNPVILCKKNADSTGCNGDGDWSQGWIVFSDDNGDGGVTSGETILLNHEALDERITFGGTNGVADSITYQPAGTTSVDSIETLIICDERDFDESAMGVLVMITGRGSVKRKEDTGQDKCL